MTNVVNWRPLTLAQARHAGTHSQGGCRSLPAADISQTEAPYACKVRMYKMRYRSSDSMPARLMEADVAMLLRQAEVTAAWVKHCFRKNVDPAPAQRRWAVGEAGANATCTFEDKINTRENTGLLLRHKGIGIMYLSDRKSVARKDPTSARPPLTSPCQGRQQPVLALYTPVSFNLGGIYALEFSEVFQYSPQKRSRAVLV